MLFQNVSSYSETSGFRSRQYGETTVGMFQVLLGPGAPLVPKVCELKPLMAGIGTPNSRMDRTYCHEKYHVYLYQFNNYIDKAVTIHPSIHPSSFVVNKCSLA